MPEEPPPAALASPAGAAAAPGAASLAAGGAFEAASTLSSPALSLPVARSSCSFILDEVKLSILLEMVFAAFLKGARMASLRLMGFSTMSTMTASQGLPL